MANSLSARSNPFGNNAKPNPFGSDAKPNPFGLAQSPDRMWIADTKTGAFLNAQYNPSEFEETLKVGWVRLAPPGLSHQPLQYAGTENTTLSFSLVFDAGVSGMDTEGILKARRFLQSLCYARKGASNVREGQAVRALFVWPTFLTLDCIVSELQFKYERFNLEGTPTRYSVRLGLEEIRDVRLYSEDVRGA